MKTWKRIASLALAICMIFTIMIIPDTQASAKAKLESKTVTVYANQTYTNTLRVIYGANDYTITDIKSSDASNLIARQTRQSRPTKKATYTTDEPYGYAEIGFYAKKTGNYKVTFNVSDKNGKKNNSFSVKVKAVNYSYTSSPVKYASYAGKKSNTLSNPFNTLTSKTSGKFKVVTNSGYKVKSIEMRYYDKNGKQQTKKLTNGKTISLSQYADKSEYENSNSYYYDNDDDEYFYYSYSTDLFAETYISVEVVETKTKKITNYGYWLYVMPKN